MGRRCKEVSSAMSCRQSPEGGLFLGHRGLLQRQMTKLSYKHKRPSEGPENAFYEVLVFLDCSFSLAH